jgi:triacylglycerol lipase
LNVPSVVDWEMRGSRGIEFGVDLPALPAFGLGEAPHPTSTCDRPVVGPASAQTQAQGDGWGFRDWTRFVRAWKKSREDEAVGAVTRPSAQNRVKVEKAGGDCAPRREASEQHEDVPRTDSSTTDKMSTSVVFDWLVERVPAVGKPTEPGAITSLGSEKREAESMERGTEREKGVEEARGEVREEGTGGDKILHKAAVTYTVGAGVGLGPSKSSSSSLHGQKNPAERLSKMKRQMNRENKGREKKRELATREDLERFYVALARKMYDEGL